MSVNAVTLQSVSFAWGKTNDPFLLVDELNVKVGEKLFLYGPSGSGKSTLLNIISGVVAPQTGKVNLLDVSLRELSNRERDQFRAQHLGIIFQQFNLVPYLNILDNLKLRISFLPKQRRHLATQQIPALLERLQLSDLASQKAYQLSVGQQQRTALARALLGSPEIIIADEPTSALDTDLRAEFMNLLFESIDDKTTLLFVSHDQQLKSRFDSTLDILQCRAGSQRATQEGV